MKGLTLTLQLTAAPTHEYLFDSTRQDERQCNLNPFLCSRSYSNISFIGTHNSAFVGSIDDPRVNQQMSVTEQLDAGIRFLQAQVHSVDLPGKKVKAKRDFLGDLVDGVTEGVDDMDDAVGDAVDQVGDAFDDVTDAVDAIGARTLRMCHTSCALLDAGTLEAYLATVKGWMDAHPSEVVTLLLVNADNRPASEFGSVFTSTGLDQLSFIPSTTPDPLPLDAWPTLGSMIDAKTRLVTFLSTTADEVTTPYLLSEFDTYIFETPFETTDPAFPSCAVDRPPNASPHGRMVLVNHFLQHEILPDVLVPAGDEAGRTNGEESLGGHVRRCGEVFGGRKPNFVLVDWVGVGDVLGVEGALNGF